MLQWKSYYIVIIMMIIGFLIMLFLIKKQSDFSESLTKIEKDKSYDIQVKEAYNERGIYVLNNKYYLNSGTYIIGNHFGLSKDDAIWRPKNAKYKPRISDISAPFRIYKEIDSDTLNLIKGERTILLLLSKNDR